MPHASPQIWTIIVGMLIFIEENSDMPPANEHQTFAADFASSAPEFLWWNGQRVPWSSATVHLASTFWVV